jgi:flagellar biosynthetic protein FliO
MDWYQNFLKWFTSRPRWMQVVFIVLLSVLVVAGFWLTDYQSGDSTASMVDSTAWILGAILKFGIVLLLIYGAAILLRRWQVGGIKKNNRRMKILEISALTPRRAIYLVQVDGQTFMLGATDQSVNLIAEVDQMESAVADPSQHFSDALIQAGDRLDVLPGR